MNDSKIENNLTPIGKTNWRNQNKKFGIRDEDRKGHMYLIGKTGTGKSTLIANMVISDMRRGKGVAIIDPHGDMAETLLHHVPENRINDVVYFNAADTEFSIAFNPLADVPKERTHLVVSGLISVFKKMWPDFWGPRLEYILRFSLLTLLECPGTTLLDVTRLLTDFEFRKEVIKHLTQQPVKDFWTLEFDRWAPFFRAEAISPILNKFGQLVTNTPVRNIFGQKDSSFKIREIMDQEKILIVNLSKGRIGEDNSSLLGALLVTEIYLAAQTRADMPENERRPFYLYVDEFHNFITTTFSDILSESRKYGLFMTIGNQFCGQLEDTIRSAIFGNVGTLVSFRLGAEDAHYLKKEFMEMFSEADFVNLPNHNIYLKLMMNGITSDPFSATTLPFPKYDRSFGQKVIELSRQRYGKSIKIVEQEILARYKQIKPETNHELNTSLTAQ